MPNSAEPVGALPLIGETILRGLIDAGVIPANTTRVIIDIEWRERVSLYLETLADERLLGLVPMLPGVAIIREQPRSPAAERTDP
jgi:hypothetical protein